MILNGLIAAAALTGLVVFIMTMLKVTGIWQGKGQHKLAVHEARPEPEPRHAKPASDDTEQISSFDRRAYMDAQERMAHTAEIALVLDEDPLQHWRDAAWVQALLNSGYYASTPWVKAGAY
jgi:hypothetical protein